MSADAGALTSSLDQDLALFRPFEVYGLDAQRLFRPEGDRGSHFHLSSSLIDA